VATLPGQVPAPVQGLIAAEQAGAVGVALLIPRLASQAAVVGFEAERKQVHVPHGRQRQGAVQAVELHRIVAAVVPTVFACFQRPDSEGVKLAPVLEVEAGTHAIEAQAQVRDIPVCDEHLVAKGHFLAPDPRGVAPCGEVVVEVDECLADFISAFVIG